MHRTPVWRKMPQKTPFLINLYFYALFLKPIIRPIFMKKKRVYTVMITMMYFTPYLTSNA